MEEIPTTQRAFILLDMLKSKDFYLSKEEIAKIKEELLTILNIK
jgi:hypothetical protein